MKNERAKPYHNSDLTPGQLELENRRVRRVVRQMFIELETRDPYDDETSLEEPIYNAAQGILNIPRPVTGYLVGFARILRDFTFEVAWRKVSFNEQQLRDKGFLIMSEASAGLNIRFQREMMIKVKKNLEGILYDEERFPDKVRREMVQKQLEVIEGWIEHFRR